MVVVHEDGPHNPGHHVVKPLGESHHAGKTGHEGWHIGGGSRLACVLLEIEKISLYSVYKHLYCKYLHSLGLYTFTLLIIT